MTLEFDLPCSECGGDLREATIDPHELGVQMANDTAILVAECQACGERHYPSQTLSALGRRTSRES